MDLPACVDDFTTYYGVPRILVEAIYEVEKGWPGARVGPDVQGHFTLGLLQVNSLWFDQKLSVDLQRYGITAEHVQNDACTNIGMATWLLKEHYQRSGDWAKAVAQLHAGPKEWKKGIPHAHDVFRRLERRTPTE